MLFKSTQNCVYRLAYKNPNYKLFKIISQELFLSTSLLDEKEPQFINLLKEDSEIDFPEPITVVRSDRFLSLYHFLNQSLEINEFKTIFKKPTGYRSSEKIQFINRGEDLITIYSVSSSDEHFELEGFDKAIQLLPGDELNLDLSFKPTQFGFYNSKLMVKTSIHDYEMIEFDLFGVRKKGKSYYKYIDGVRYDRMLLEIAYSLVAESYFKEIDHKHLEIIVRNVWDAGYITTTEKRSLKYIWDNYNWSEGARRSFKARYGYVLND